MANSRQLKLISSKPNQTLFAPCAGGTDIRRSKPEARAREPEKELL